MSKGKSLIKNAVLSSLKTLTAIVFPLITYPYITNVLSVENIGRIDFGQSIVSYFSLIAAFGISSYAVRTGSQVLSDKDTFKRFANQIFTINCLTAIFAFVSLFLAVLLPTKLLGYRSIIMIFGINILLSPFGIEWLYIIHEDFGYITIRAFFIHLLSLILMVLFVKRNEDYLLYAGLTTLATSAGNIFNFLHSSKYTRLKIVHNCEFKRYFPFLFIFFINSIATTIYLNSDKTMLGLMCDDYAVGIYAVSTKIYSIVKQLFNAVIASVIPRLAYYRKQNIDEYKSLINKMVNVCITFVLPAVVGLIILRKEVVVVISNSKYIEATTSLMILSFAIIFAVFGNIIANGILISLEREKHVLKGTTISAIVNLLLNFLMIPLLAQNGAAITTLLAEIVMVGISGYYARDYLKGMIDWINLIKVTVCTILMGAGIIALKQYFTTSSNIINLVVMLVCGVTVYMLLLCLVREKAATGALKHFLKR